MFYNIFLCIFALAFGNNRSAERCRQRDKTNFCVMRIFFVKNFAESKNGCTFAKFSARKNGREIKRKNIEIITIDEVVQESLRFSVNSTKGVNTSQRPGYRAS